ncbi:MAG: lipase family protein [Gammaproteobacteria bacterium]|nr:lipase family protein [Gammaproteobacteria bacterium]
MFGLALLDVAIGLSFIYLVLSIACSALMELWTQVRQSRGHMLESTLQELLGDAAALSAFKNQPRILALRQASSGPRARKGGDDGLRKPTAIPGDAFADAVLALQRDPGVSLRGELSGFIQDVLRRNAYKPERVRQELAGYYDQSMERLSGHFKRWATLRLALLGAVVVVLTNTDTFSLANRLYNDANLRGGLVQQAEEYIAAQEKKSAAANAALDLATGNLNKSLALAAAPLFGWDRKAWCERFGSLFYAGDCGESRPAGALELAGNWLHWLFGVFLTVMAICMGADFWFNNLQKLLAARQLLRKQEGASTPVEGGAAAPASATAPPAPAVSAPLLPVDALTVGWRGFRPSATAFSLVSAYWLGRAAELAYETDRSQVQAQADAWGLRVEFIAVEQASTEAYLFYAGEFMVLAFRGTQETQDFLTDARFAQVAWPVAVGELVHKGFHEALDAAWADILAALARARARTGSELAPALWLTGHSLGAALATLAAARISREAPAHRQQVMGLYTFGSPRCGDAGLVQALDRLCKDRLFRFVNHRDAVTRVPPRVCPGVAAGYEHAGLPLYFDSRGSLQRDPGFWFRFLDTAIPGTDLADGERETLASELRDAFADHGMARYRGLLEQQPELRRLLA